MKKSWIIGLFVVAALVAMFVIPRHMNSVEEENKVSAEATNKNETTKAESTSVTSSQSEKDTTATTTVVTETEDETESQNTETSVSVTKVMLKNSVPIEVLDQWIEDYMEPSYTLLAPPVTTTVTTTNVETTENAENTETTATTAEETAETTAVYKEIVMKRVLVKPEQEVDGLLLREESPMWQLILEYREEYNGVLTTKLLAAPDDYFDPMNPEYKTQNWYFSTKPYVKIGEEYYKPIALIDAIIEKFKVDPDTIKPYEPLVIVSFNQENQKEETQDESEKKLDEGMILYDEEGNEYLITE